MDTLVRQLLSGKHQPNADAGRKKLYFSILQARRLETKFAGASFFCKVKLGKYSEWSGDNNMEKFETKPVTTPANEPEGPKTLLQINENFQRIVAAADVEKFQVRIKLEGKSGILPTKCLGFIAVRLDALKAGHAVDRWWPLRGEPGEDAPVGEVRLQLLMLDENVFEKRFPDGIVDAAAVFQRLSEHPMTEGCCCYECDPNFIDSSDNTQYKLKKFVTEVAEELVDV